MPRFLIVFAAAAAAIFGSLVQPAEATAYNLGQLGPPADVAQLITVPKGSINDTFSFTVGKAADGTTNAVNFTILNNNGSERYNITNLAYSLTDSLSNIIVPYSLAAATPTGSIFTGLQAGVVYSLNIFGTADGTQGGRYTAGVTTTNVVPVPGAVFLFAPALAGLAGLKRFRRKDADNDTVPAAA